MTEDFVLRPEAEIVAPAPVPQDSVEATAFDRARDLGTQGAWDAFLKNYPEGVFADLARAAVADLGPALPKARPEDAPKSPADAIVDSFAARKKLEQLWDQGYDLATAGDDPASFRALHEALELARSQFGTDSEEYARANNHMVGSWTSMGRLDEAMQASREAIRVFTALYGADDTRVLSEQSNLAARLNATGSRAEAERMYDEILAAYQGRTLSGWDHVSYSHALEGYSQLLVGKGDRETALLYARQAVENMEQSGNTAVINYGWIASHYGRLLLETGACNEGLANFGKAAAGMKAARVAETQSDHAEILRILDRGC